MERIIRLNAVEIFCLSGIVGMNQHSLHPSGHLAPQNALGMNFSSLIEAFLDTANTKCNILLAFKAAIGKHDSYMHCCKHIIALHKLKLNLHLIAIMVVSSCVESQNLIKLNCYGGVENN